MNLFKVCRRNISFR